MEKPIVTALLAYGMSGKVFHAPFLATNQGFELYGVLERNDKKAVLDYRLANDINEIIIEIDKEAVFWRKEK